MHRLASHQNASRRPAGGAVVGLPYDGPWVCRIPQAATRLQQGLTRKALGITAQLTGQAIASIETGARFPRSDTVEQSAKALGVALRAF